MHGVNFFYNFVLIFIFSYIAVPSVRFHDIIIIIIIIMRTTFCLKIPVVSYSD